MDWTDFKALAAVASGIALSMLLSTATTWRARLTCVAAGTVCAWFGTEPVIHLAGQSYGASGWPYVIAGLLAMTGDRLVRRVLFIVDTIQIPPLLGGDK
jgi:hypothetical protein